MVLESVLVSNHWSSGWPVFPLPLVKEVVFFPLYILASFVNGKVSIGLWIYFWAFYSVPSISISVFVPVPYCLDDCGFVVFSLKSGRLIPPVPFFFLKITLAIQGFLYFHTNCEIICSSSVKNTIGNLIGIVNLLPKEIPLEKRESVFKNSNPMVKLY